MSNIWMVLQQTAAASLVALFVLVLQKIFQDKLSPKWQYTIWGVLLCRLVIPVGWSTGSVLDVTGPLDILRVWKELKLDSAWASPWWASLPGLSVPALPGGMPRSVTDWLFVGYLLGVAVCGVWLLWGWLRLRKMVKSAVPVVGERLEEVRAISARLELKAPARVVETLSAHGPFLMGVFRPTLVVPMGWQVDEKVLLHELIHRKNQDVLAGWVTALFRCIHWCNPFLWWVFDRIDNQREERCDQQVLERLEGEERRDYGRVLLSMAEDQVIRVPGATSMANGAQRIKQRIQSIARFKTFPTGMGLVTVCMTLILIPYLVVGFPATAAVAEEDVYLDRVEQALSYAQRNPATTVAGALHSHSWWMYYQVQSPKEALMARAMVTEGANMPKMLEQYENNWARWREGTSRHDELDEAYRTGPLFRGLTQLDENRWVCQVYMFRDQEWDLQPGDRMPTIEETPVEYLCHTVEIVRQENGQHTVELLKEATGEIPGNTDLTWGEGEGLEELPLIWTGQAAGIQVTVRPSQTLQIRDGWYNGWTRDMWNFLDINGELARMPDGDANFSACRGSSEVTLVNTNDVQAKVTLEVTPKWTWYPDMDAAHNYTANSDSYDGTMQAGQEVVKDGSGGGVDHFNSVELEHCLCPDAYTATLTVDGVEYPLTLEREVTWYD